MDFAHILAIIIVIIVFLLILIGLCLNMNDTPWKCVCFGKKCWPICCSHYSTGLLINGKRVEKCCFWYYLSNYSRIEDSENLSYV